MAHINAARFGNGKNAKLIVVDPRVTRTARQCDPNRGDKYVRIRPGTNVAFSNGLLKWIFDNVATYNSVAWDRMLQIQNATTTNSQAGRAFINDLGAAVTVAGFPKWNDARFLVNAAGTDYERDVALGAKTAAVDPGVRSSVSLVGSTYHMWYKAADADLFLSHATSSDGITWSAGVLTDLPGDGDHDNPFMWAEGTTYYMVNRSGANGIEFRSITTATPAAIEVNANWTTPIVILRPADVTDAGMSGLDQPTVLKDGANYRLYFKAQDGTGKRYIFAGTTAIAPGSWADRATLPTSFVKFGPTTWQVFGPSAAGWDNGNVQHPNVTKNAGRYDMWYTGSGSVDLTLLVGYATSADGITWTRSPKGAQGYWVGNTPAPGASAAKPSMAGGRLFVEEQTARIVSYAAAVNSVATGGISNFPVLAPTVTTPGTVWESLKLHLAPYDSATVADICGCSEADVAFVAQALIDNSRFASTDWDAGTNGATPKATTYKATTILYAMGQTQFTNGSQNIKDLAVIQTILGNMGRPGGGINALRGIHNVQGSTDMGTLFDSIPGYSGNPLVDEHYSHYQNALFGARVEGTGAVANPGGGSAAVLGLQQRGFHNMTNEWFGNGTTATTDMEKLYDLWPKGNGVQHIKTFRNMTLPLNDPNRIISSVVWGQNPAVTEPNQSKVRAGLRNLDLLAVVDMYETETAACDRKPDGVTYLVPACSHVEEAGSVTNSGRWLQWRERATAPKGNSKADIELLLRFAYALDKKGAFTHITNVAYDGADSAVPTGGVWSTLATKINGPAYHNLYGAKYGWTPGDATAFEAITGTTERWAPGSATPDLAATLKGSEIVCEAIYKEFARPLNHVGASGLADDFSTITGGTMWIYSGNGTAGAEVSGQAGYNPGTFANTMPAITFDTTARPWQVKNKAKSRNNVVTGAGSATDPTNANNYPRWGWAWLLNRRVFYNNTEVAGDQTDNFVSPGYVSCMFTMSSSNTLADWSGPLAYRKYKTFADAPSVATGPHFVAPGKTFMGRFPGHTEPYESPREDIVALYGHNMSGTSRLIVEGTDGTAIGTVATYPLVLTTIRCVEHFQGGPTTRNNSWNVEAEPVPWIEINSIDARNYGISDGDWVNVITARSNSTSDEKAETPANTANWARGFKARVGVGVQTNQRVGVGVVAIPWHWGDKGLSTGSRANDLCIDAWDANTTIPEYKVCLCRIVKL
jgi:formate dehydrogenase major subunit